MRLPVTPQISTKDGVSAKNARLTNVLKEVRKTGELAVVRPGLSLSTTYAGLGNGLIVFDGRLLVMVDDTIYDPEWEYFGWPLDSAPWSVSTTYSINDSVWYGGDLWFSWGGGNIGNTPAAGSTYWGSSSTTDTWSEDTTYDIGDEVLVDGVSYYSNVASQSGHTPSASSDWWSTEPIGASRYKIDYVSTPYGGYFGQGPLAGTREGATVGAQALITPRSCVTGNWVGDPSAPNYNGSAWYGNTQWYGGSCEAPLGPFVGSIGEIIQTA